MTQLERINPTPVSLLERLRKPAAEAQQAWSQFVRLYTPLLYAGVRRFGLTGADADDVVQDIFAQLVRKLPELSYQQGRFRSWLWTVLAHKCQERARRQKRVPSPAGDESLANVADSDNVAAWAEAEYNRFIVDRALQALQSEFAPDIWELFRLYVIEERSAAEVSEAKGVTVNAVYLAKSRVFRRLRKELQGLID